MSISNRKRPQRLQLACEPCKLGKIKCDRALPICVQCYKRSRESDCRYTERGLRHHEAAGKATTMREKLEELEVLVGALKPSKAQDKAVLSLATPDASSTADTPTDADVRPANMLTSAWDDPRYWDNITSNIADAEVLLYNDDSTESMDTPWTSVRSNTGHKPPLPSTTISTDEIIAQLPSRVELNRLIAIWFTIEHPAGEQYRRFWEDTKSVDRAWLALMLSIATVGAKCSAVKQTASSQLQHLHHLCELTIAGMNDPQPYLIEALAFRALSLVLRYHDEDFQAWHTIEHALRLCYQAGYHRDVGQDVSQLEDEMRRRTWMVVCELETSISSMMGMPRYHNSAFCNTRLPSADSTSVRAAIGLSQASELLSTAATISQQIVPAAQDDVYETHLHITRSLDLLPDEWRLSSLQHLCLGSAPDVANRVGIQLIIHKAICTLHQRHMDETNSRARCLSAAREIVQLITTMLELECSQLVPVRVVLLEHVHTFKLATTLICHELHKKSEAYLVSLEDLAALRVKLVHAYQLWLMSGLLSSKTMAMLETVLRDPQNYLLSPPDLSLIGQEAMLSPPTEPGTRQVPDDLLRASTCADQHEVAARTLARYEMNSGLNWMTAAEFN